MGKPACRTEALGHTVPQRIATTPIPKAAAMCVRVRHARPSGSRLGHQRNTVLSEPFARRAQPESAHSAQKVDKHEKPKTKTHTKKKNTTLYYTILYYTILYCTVLYCTILYYTILYYTILLLLLLLLLLVSLLLLLYILTFAITLSHFVSVLG